MKKLCLLFLAVLLMPLCVNAQNVVDGNYTFTINSISFNVYDEDGFMVKDETSNTLKMYATPLYSKDLSLIYTPTFSTGLWDMGENGKINMREMRLNTNFQNDTTAQSNITNLFDENVTDKSVDYFVAIMVNYQMTAHPSAITKVEYNNTMESSMNALLGSTTYKNLEVTTTSIIEQPIFFGKYDSENGKIQLLSEETLTMDTQDSSVLFFYNYLKFTGQDDPAGYYIHDFSDISNIRNYLKERVLPVLSVSNQSDGNHVKGSATFPTDYSGAKVCKLYRSETENGSYTLLTSGDCSDGKEVTYLDSKISSDKAYFYKIEVDGSEKTILNTTNEYMEDVVSINNNQLVLSNSKDETTTNNKTNPKTGVNNNYIGIGIIGLLSIGGLIYLKKKDVIFQ